MPIYAIKYYNRKNNLFYGIVGRYLEKILTRLIYKHQNRILSIINKEIFICGIIYRNLYIICLIYMFNIYALSMFMSNIKSS